MAARFETLSLVTKRACIAARFVTLVTPWVRPVSGRGVRCTSLSAQKSIAATASLVVMVKKESWGCSNPKCGQRRFVTIREFKAQPGFSCKFRAQELCESRGGRPGLPSPINLRFLWMLSNTSATAANIENLGHLVL